MGLSFIMLGAQAPDAMLINALSTESREP